METSKTIGRIDIMFTHNFITPPVMKKVTGVDGKRHYVTPEGNNYESVTTYLDRTFAKPKLHEWRKRIGQKKATEITVAAAKRGKSFHSIAESYLMNETIDLEDDPNTKSLFVKAKPYLNRLNNIRLLEKSIYSDELQLAGTPDYIGDFDNELAVVDFKSNSWTKKSIFDIIPYLLQTACYAKMFNERFGAMPQKAVIIVASPQAINGILWDVPMVQCLAHLERFRGDPSGYQDRIARVVTARNRKAVKPLDSFNIPEANQEVTPSG